MAKDQPEYEDKDSSGPRSGTLAVAETLRSVSAGRDEAPAKEGKSDEKISVFWRVFGGTLLSIGALVVMTAYSGLSGAITDLRRELNAEMEKRSEFARKDDLTSRITSQWNIIKDIQNATGALGTVGDRVKVLDSQLDRVAKNCEEDRTSIKQNMAEQRKTCQDDKTELQRRLDDQRRAFDEERREMLRKFDDLRKESDSDRRELLTRVQTLSERLVAVEALTSTSRAAPKTPLTATSGN